MKNIETDDNYKLTLRFWESLLEKQGDTNFKISAVEALREYSEKITKDTKRWRSEIPNYINTPESIAVSAKSGTAPVNTHVMNLFNKDIESELTGVLGSEELKIVIDEYTEIRINASVSEPRRSDTAADRHVNIKTMNLNESDLSMDQVNDLANFFCYIRDTYGVNNEKNKQHELNIAPSGTEVRPLNTNKSAMALLESAKSTLDSHWKVAVRWDGSLNLDSFLEIRAALTRLNDWALSIERSNVLHNEIRNKVGGDIT